MVLVRLAALEVAHWAKAREAKQSRIIFAVVRSLVRRVEKQAKHLQTRFAGRNIPRVVPKDEMPQRPQTIPASSLLAVRCMGTNSSECDGAHEFWVALCLEDVDCRRQSKICIQWLEAAGDSHSAYTEDTRYKRGLTQRINVMTILCVLRSRLGADVSNGTAVKLTVQEYDKAMLAAETANQLFDAAGVRITGSASARSKRVSRPVARAEGFVDPTLPGISFAQPKGGVARTHRGPQLQPQQPQQRLSSGAPAITRSWVPATKRRRVGSAQWAAAADREPGRDSATPSHIAGITQGTSSQQCQLLKRAPPRPTPRRRSIPRDLEAAKHTDNELRLRRCLRRSDFVRSVQLLRSKEIFVRRSRNLYVQATVVGIDMRHGVRRTRVKVAGNVSSQRFEWVDARLLVGSVELL
eukprot:COSAG01_NODE_2586_length_7416_cov_48.667213_2_plen_410_part_00